MSRVLGSIDHTNCSVSSKPAAFRQGDCSACQGRDYVSFGAEPASPVIARVARASRPALPSPLPLERGNSARREDREHESEFVTISYWESVEAMSRFAGPDPRRIHHLPRDQEFLIDLPQSVQVLRITSSKGVFGA